MPTNDEADIRQAGEKLIEWRRRREEAKDDPAKLDCIDNCYSAYYRCMSYCPPLNPEHDRCVEGCSNGLWKCFDRCSANP